MTVFDTTRRDLPGSYGWAFIPVNWDAITVGDTVLWREGLVWQVVNVEKHYATAMVRLKHAAREGVVEVTLGEAVLVLQDETAWRRTEFEGGTPVRQRPGAKRSD